MREQKGRLGNYVRNARAEKFTTLSAWAKHLNISERTLGDLERGNGAGPNTIAAVENALGWVPGSARDILNGGEPSLLEQPAASEPEPSLEERLDRLEATAEEWIRNGNELRDEIAAIRQSQRRRTG